MPGKPRIHEATYRSDQENGSLQCASSRVLISSIFLRCPAIAQRHPLVGVVGCVAVTVFGGWSGKMRM